MSDWQLTYCYQSRRAQSPVDTARRIQQHYNIDEAVWITPFVEELRLLWEEGRTFALGFLNIAEYAHALKDKHPIMRNPSMFASLNLL